MKKRIAFMLLWPAWFIASGQQDAQFSQNMFNKLCFNPGFAGMNHGYCISGHYRNQWVGFTGAPVSTLVNANAFVPGMQGGLGFTAMEDRLGNEKNFSAALSGARHFNLWGGELSAGARLGWMQKSFFDNWIASDGVPGDNSIPVNTQPLSFLDLGAGLFYLDARETYVGLSVSHAYNAGNAIAQNYYTNVPHYYLTAGTTINLPGMRSIALRPSFLAKSDGKATIFDVSTLVFVRNRFFFGGSYRMTDAVVAMAGMMWGPGKICYSYDITTSELKNHSSNTHEIMISWCHPLTGKKHVESHVNPREMGVGPVNGSDYYVESRCTLMRQLTGTMNYVQ